MRSRVLYPRHRFGLEGKLQVRKPLNFISSAYWYSDEVDPIRRGRRPNRQEIEPQTLAIRALQRFGFSSVCAGEPNDLANRGQVFSGTISAATGVGIILSLKFGLNLSFLEAVLIFMVTTIMLILSSVLIRPMGAQGMLIPTICLAVLIISWIGIGVAVISAGHGRELLVSYVAPFVTVFVLRWSGRALRLATEVPLFIPAALVIVVAPMFTGDPWRFAAAARMRLLYVAVITVVPLLALVLSRFSRMPLGPVFDRAVKSIEEDANVTASARIFLRKRCLTREHWPRQSKLDSYFHRPYQKDVLEPRAAELRNLASAVFHRRARSSLVSLLIGTFAATYLIAYVLAASAVPSGLAKDWSNTSPTVITIRPVPEFRIELPWWPYTGVAFLFSIISAVGFLALALTEETYTTALVDATFGRIARLLIIAGVPFLFHGGRVKPVNPVSASSGDSKVLSSGEQQQANRGPRGRKVAVAKNGTAGRSSSKAS
jgi:hypothetical protein